MALTTRNIVKPTHRITRDPVTGKTTRIELTPLFEAYERAVHAIEREMLSMTRTEMEIYVRDIEKWLAAMKPHVADGPTPSEMELQQAFALVSSLYTPTQGT